MPAHLIASEWSVWKAVETKNQRTNETAKAITIKRRIKSTICPFKDLIIPRVSVSLKDLATVNLS
jgi:hypothetical protein